MKCSLWLYPPPAVADDLRSLIQDLSEYGPEPRIPFEPHVTVVGNIECEDEADGVKLCEFLECKLKGQFETGIDCCFHPNAVSIEGKDTPLQWNQALVTVLHLTPSLLNLVDQSREALNKLPPNVLPPDVSRFAPPLRKPHLSLYYGSQKAPSPDSIAPMAPFTATELGLWKTEPRGLEGVGEWKEIGRISLV